MKPLTDDELVALIQDIESDRVERKETWRGSAPEKGREAVCAFANDLPHHGLPGVLFVGIKDDGTPAGPEFEVTDQLLQTLADIKTDGKITPPPTMTVAKRAVLGRDVAVVTVWPADAPPVRLDGRLWIRTGPRRGQATAQDERVLNEKRRYQDRSFDTHPIHSSTLDDLSRAYFETEYLPQAVARDVLEANGRSLEERLASLGMIASVDDTTPTVVGMLTLGKSPRTWVQSAYVQFLRIRGTQWGDPVLDEQELDGSLDTMLRRLDDKLRATLSVSVDFTSGATTEIRSSAYPLSALQQLVRNAVMHRTYEGTNAPVRVYWFDDRIEISNPGGPYGAVTVENFGRPGISDYRNPVLAGVLKTLGFVQRFGFGIAESRRALQANGNPPLEFQVEPTVVLATIRKAT
ncbi:ATP-binding protein [Variovorax paradoxus]|uniref:ATP-binding protein n=1 Tax=Variovorax paradoxus TaxID=34073 RepID=UPI0029C7AA71|nr:ATP-binding protein [Variovorax paradoxus]